MATYHIIPIDKGWTFKQADNDESEFLPVAQFPTNVHLDLMANKLLEDPFMGKNELGAQWVGEAVWVYKTTFVTPSFVEGGESLAQAVISFEGLDTFATVLLNGQEILKTESMFISERVDVTNLLRNGSDNGNEIQITFDSAYLKGKKLVDEHPEHKWGCWNGDPSRLAVRKAQYHWGWDWGPMLMTCGPWRPINLEIYTSRVADLHFSTKIDQALTMAEVVVGVDVEGPASLVKISISLDKKLVTEETIPVSNGHAKTSFRLNDPQLWYPIRYGQQPLYTATATLLATSTDNTKTHTIHSVSKKFGVRKVELIQRPLLDQPGTTFFFQVNNISIWCGGSDWIPADNFLPRITREKYYDWVKLVAEGNQFMIRVWGGGIYEDQAFYDACDELGILVWQDFMFGCGNYPAYAEILDLIQREAEDNVKRLRHHPCLVIWAGNNEDYQYQEDEKLTYDYENKNPDSWLQTDFPARYIYEKVLADVCSSLIPETAYHYGSPWGGGVATTDRTVGDIHQWNVWHGTQARYQDFDKLVGRFVSEFGMEAFPNIKTIDSFLPLGKADPDRYPQSSTIDFHNKAAGHERRIALYLVENFRYAPEPIEQFIYCTQLMQAECLASAYRLWKRQWKGPGREYCGGALVWQTNDCWPVTSWAIVDFYLRPKHAYFTIKREMAPISSGIKRTETYIPRDKYTSAYVTKKTTIEIWGSNLTLDDTVVNVIVKAWDIITGQETYSVTLKSEFVLGANQSTEIGEMEVPVLHEGYENRTVIGVYFLQEGRQIARYINWPEPLKYVHLQAPKHLTAEVSQDGKLVELSSEVPVKGVVVECDDEEVSFSDNMVDLVPGEIIPIQMKGAHKECQINVRYLGLGMI
ncbi:putative beta-mannosidase B [Talaromyces proteolyticus]|uniref:Beta-mannosidase B n=1 Tax=Talaromyces proteolyticus TaxID=1131652 RepID=A0AAD4Q019_9EURO|nr:putative beta-mannosidase B [Talaromyces proteolyticus]KAH8703623.1 putative beta-mannosidase B [Talaromyces proteolyticus]